MKKWQVMFGFLAISLLIGTGFLLKPIFEGMAKAEGSEESDIPILRLYLNGVSLEEVKMGGKYLKYEGNHLVVNDKNTNLDFNEVQIKGRGNSTWGAIWDGNLVPKFPFQIKFKRKVDLLGLGERKKYTLLTNWYDTSFLRNDIMSKLSEMTDNNYRSRGRFVEFYIDDDYQGLYYLMTKIELGKNGIDFRDEYASLFELDTLHQYTEECYYSEAGECLLLKDAVFEDDETMLGEVVDGFMRQFNLLEKAARKKDFDAVFDLIDIKSFAEYFLISDFADNPDAYVSSFNFYRDGLDDKIHAGPLWDFDLAFSNQQQWIFSAQDNSGFIEYDINDDSGTGKLMYYLMEIPEFEEEVARIWREKLSGRKDELLIHISKQAEYIREAALRDEVKWREEPLFEAEVEYLLDWVSRRYDFFEQRYGGETMRTVL